MRVGPFAFRYQVNGATPCQYIDTTRRAIDCATTLPLSFYIMKLCTAADFSSSIVEIVQKTTNLGTLSPFWGSQCPVFVKCNWFFFYILRLRRYKAKCVKTRCLQDGVGHLEPRFPGKGVVPLPIYWFFYTTRKAIDCATTLPPRLYIMKLCSRLFVLYCRNCPKDDKFRYFIPILRKLGAA